jgi:hypothetical protein
MTAAKFRHFTFSVLGYAQSNVVETLVFMILNDFCLLPAKFCYVIVKVRNLVGQMHIANRCVSGYSWCADTYLADTPIPIDGFLRQIPRRDKLKPLQV